MSHDQLLLIIGAGILVLLATAFLLLFSGAEEQRIAHRIRNLHQGVDTAQPRSVRFWPTLVSLVGYLGNAVRGRILSARDAEDLAKTLAAAGFEPANAVPIFMGTKAACLVGIPTLTYLGMVVLGYPLLKQAVCIGMSLAVGMMLPNWVVTVIRRRYHAALRRGLPDALDLMVVCAEAGLGLASAIERVAQEMKKSNRPVALEFSVFTHEMRIMPDRRVALANLAERTGQPTFKRLAGTLSQTLKYGTPLAQALRTLAAEMRNERMIHFEERAGKLPALLVMPMMVFILPCLFIILMGQPVSQLLGALRSMHH